MVRSFGYAADSLPATPPGETSVVQSAYVADWYVNSAAQRRPSTMRRYVSRRGSAAPACKKAEPVATSCFVASGSLLD